MNANATGRLAPFRYLFNGLLDISTPFIRINRPMNQHLDTIT